MKGYSYQGLFCIYMTIAASPVPYGADEDNETMLHMSTLGKETFPP